MTTESFDIGDKERFKATFKDDAGALKNPTTVVATLREPDGAISTPTVTNQSVGVHTIDHTMAKTGRHFLGFKGTGVVVSSQEIEFYVKVENAK